MQRQLRRLRHRAHQQEQADGGNDRAAFGQLVQPVEQATIVQHPQVEEDQKSREDHADVADGVHHEGLATGKHGRGSLEPEADQQVGAEADTRPTNDQPDEIPGQDEQQHRKHEEIHVGEESRVTRVFPHVADRVDMDHEADAGDYEDHQGGERVHIQVEGDVEITTLPPDEIRLIQGLRACQQLDQDGKRQDEPETYAAGADPAHDLAGQQAAEQRIDQETGKRRQENQRRQRIHGPATPSSNRVRRHPSVGRLGRPAR